MIRKIKKALIWYWLLNKRLFKKAGFIIILALIPLLAFSMTVAVKNEDSGMIRIAVVAVEPEDVLVSKIMDKIQNDGNVFVFSFLDSVDEAKRCVENKTVDAAWVFEAGFEQKVIDSLKSSNESLVSVYAVQDNIFFKASKEKIYSLLLPDVSYEIYESYVKEMVPEGSYTDEQLREKYDYYKTDDKLVEFSFLDSDQAYIEDTNYLTSTIRGLMAVVMLLSGLAATMYFISDDKNGTYFWLTEKAKFAVLFASNIAALSITAVFAIIALLLSNNVLSLKRDIGLMALYVLSASAFCSLVGTVCNSMNKMAIALPTVLVASLVMCPVFFNTSFCKPIEVMLPPYLYLYAINNLSFSKWMVLYTVVTLFVAYAVYFIQNRLTWLKIPNKFSK